MSEHRPGKRPGGGGLRKIRAPRLSFRDLMLARPRRAHGGTGKHFDLSIGDLDGIERTPGVCGGVPCIRRTRIPVWTLEQARRLGSTEAEILTDYPGLEARDLVNAWDYVERHREEIDEQIRRNEEA